MPNCTSEHFTKQPGQISVIMSSLVIWDQKLREIKLFDHDHRHKAWLQDEISSISDSIGQRFSNVVSGLTAAASLGNCRNANSWGPLKLLNLNI